MTSAPRCPQCGTPLIQRRRGATLRKRGPGYTCPQGEIDRIGEHAHRWYNHDDPAPTNRPVPECRPNAVPIPDDGVPF